MSAAWYELNTVTIIQFGRLSDKLVWNNGEEAVGGECSWAIPVSQTTITQTLCHLLNVPSFLSSRVGALLATGIM